MLKKIISFSLFICFVISGCSLSVDATEVPSATQTPFSVAATSEPETKFLTVCLAHEPNTLYPFGELNSAAQSVLASVYDGPFDTISYEYQPVILEKMPSIENGDAQIVTIDVGNGDRVIDTQGNLVTLETGMQIRPSGCRADDCAITYDGDGKIEMDQMLVTFRLRPNLTWSDGTPITADDSVYAFEVDSNDNVAASDYLLERTQIYEAADPQTLQWWGVPGFFDPTYFTNFWAPAPKHIWGQFPADQLPTVDVASHTPIGWGPFVITEWIAGDHIVMTKNPYYFRAGDGFPKVDELTFRFIPNPDMALSELVAGRCDIIDPSIPLDAHVGLLTEMQAAGEVNMFTGSGMTVEWLGLGVVPASYDNGYDIQRDRQNFFADAHTRQGIAFCLDRQSVVDNVLFGLTTVPNTYLPTTHPLYDSNIESIPFDSSVGNSLLELAGWLDTDDDPSTPRRAISVKDVAYNTPLVLNYYTTTATQRRQVVDILQVSLAECGVGLNVHYFLQNDLYAGGPVGSLFGRNFDLAEYAMGVNGIEPPCNWFDGSEIPTGENSWTGTNITGYQSDEYDETCREAKSSLPEDASYRTLYQRTQILFASDLPAIPLYFRLQVAATGPEICHFDFDSTANPLWNIESVDTGGACQK